MVAREQTLMEQFIELVENNPEKHFEFNAAGEIVEVSPKRIHSWIQTTIAYILRMYISALPGFEVLTECAHDLDGWPCRPDVSVDRSGDDEIPTEAPLLAVEIKSKSNSYTDQREKARKYLEHGTQMVWLVFPEKRIVEVYLAGADLQLLIPGDTLEGAAPLPGFSVAIADLFPPGD